MPRFGKRLASASELAALMPQSFPARLVLPGGDAFDAAATALDPDSLKILTPHKLAEGTPLTALIEEVGRLDGRAAEAEEDGFWMSLDLPQPQRQRFIRHLRWLVRKEMGEAAANRRHTRFAPRQATARLVLAGGREQSCELIDISLSGAGVRSALLPSIGSPLTLGRMRGRVVRHFAGGFAIEFLSPLERSDLDSALR